MLNFLEYITGRVIAILFAMALLAFILLIIGFASGLMLAVIAITIPIVILKILFGKNKPKITYHYERKD
ncbi:hypothetical protein PsW64_03688 [Pseudovibrio sp. W64]|uniref:hypothetical protein n=1 Tax=unclassified Pseudovibrio TaxID=2627060 RepID=UPI0007B1AD96|nr:MULTISPECIES: hypothetical protein [unclassified Pseudovibrio]KZK75670.1 hypothetical protein PsAD46_05578 [Pseudovibrio sp. Ad46]KZK78050.1 hypothetical protein PsW64_03688 [Pseudovibrio sp. W64]KZK79267.1 hypothetical protein PsAD13_05110 [Pseudovibrio sp. Ad13]KZK99626.1 hypothetical protein PsAD5_01266 [Pseudovibrio sp. Ad5]KZK99847.1 hypothetical protein PsW74_02457 [Pseudovibrio sp. W74]